VQEFEKKQREKEKKPSPPSDYDRTLIKEVKRAKKAGKQVAQLGEQQLQSIPPLKITNQYGSNQKMMEKPIDKEIDLMELAQFYHDQGLDIGDIFPPAPTVDTWQKFEVGKSLWNPDTMSKLGTQMYLLNKWYLEACGRGESFICVRIKEEHWFRGDDVMYIEFAELHQLCHMKDLDKTIISCYCL